MSKKTEKTNTKDKQDRRLIPRAQRSSPTTGQSAGARTLSWTQMSRDEQAVVRLLDGKDRPRFERSVAFLADGLSGEATSLRVRNALRRVVSCGWADRVARGVYRVSESGRRRTREATT